MIAVIGAVIGAVTGAFQKKRLGAERELQEKCAQLGFDGEPTAEPPAGLDQEHSRRRTATG